MYSFMLSWWFVISVNIILIPLTNSYIHPDEHYQSIEPLLKYVCNGLNKTLYNGSITWEYLTTSNLPIRSITILRLYYELLIRSIMSLDPFEIILAVKYYNFTIFMITYLLYNKVFVKNKFNKRISKVLMLGSYTLLTYQIRSFSNSIETVLLMLFLICLNSNSFFSLGLIFAIGIHNRITFILWLILPCAYKAYHILLNKSLKSVIVYAVSLTVSLTLAITIISKMDSLVYFNNEKFIFTPLENWKYNKNHSNLAKHGIHSRFNHLLINLPVLISPFVLLLIALTFKSNIFIENKLPLLTCISGLFFLSLFPHQEARFLIPLIPLFYSSIDFQILKVQYTKSTLAFKKRILQFFILGHIIFNILMLLIIGSWHQSGLITITKNVSFLNTINNNDIIFWHTLMPLHWPFYLNSVDKANLYINFVDDEANEYGFRQLKTSHDLKQSHNIYDFMGVSTENFEYLINDLKIKKQESSIMMDLVIPTRFREDLDLLGYKYEIIDHMPYHLNLNDGFDKSPLGLDILKVVF